MKDAKGLHTEILEREDLDYRRGWKRGQVAVSAFMWGATTILAIIMFGGFR